MSNCINCGHREESHVQNNGENTCQVCDCRDFKLTPDTQTQAEAAKEKLAEQFQKETGHDPFVVDIMGEYINTDEYIVWLESLAVRERERNKADLETLAKTMIACELATGHGDDINSLCLELRTQWEELSSKYSAEWEEMEARLRLILPMAKGYAVEHRVGSNEAYIADVEEFLSPMG